MSLPGDSGRYGLAWLVAGLIAFVFCAHDILVRDTDWTRMMAGHPWETLARFGRPDLTLLPDLLAPALETVLMATLASFVGLVLALPVAWLGAANISPFGLISFTAGRSLMTLSRSVHEMVWALLFVSAVGLGALPGILALAVRSVGFLARTLAEAIEDVAPGPIEAIRATGGSPFQVVLFGIVPQVLPTFVGCVIFEWDINIRRSTILGLVGAGGLGLALFRQMARADYAGVAAVILVVLALILAGEIISDRARKAVI